MAIISLHSHAGFCIKDKLFIISDIPILTKGKSEFFKEELAKPVLASVSEMAENHFFKKHQHPWGQLAYASSGIMKVSVANASFIIPPERALWIPRYTPHEISTRYGASYRSLYINNDWARFLPNSTTSINVDGLLRELILAVTHWGENYAVDSTKQRLISVLIDQIQSASTAPLFLNMPKDKRLQKISTILNSDPANSTTLEKWSETIGATPRTLNRLFQKETKMGFVEWRQRLRILYSLERIDRGEAINLIALDMGYDSASAFITMFKKHMGCSPKQYFKTANKHPVINFNSTQASAT